MPPAPDPAISSALDQPPLGSGDVAEERQRLASRVLADALLLGVVGDALLRVAPWGANITLWSVGIVVALLTLARRRDEGIPVETRWLAATACGLGLLFSWRDSGPLAFYNAVALLATVSLVGMTLATPQASVFASRVRDIVFAAIRTAFGTAVGMLSLVFLDVSLRRVTRSRGAPHVIAVVRALLIAIPLLLIFGGLFASADPVFARILGNLIRVDPEEVVSHVVLTGVIAFVVGGFLRTTLLAKPEPIFQPRFPDGALGLTEVSVSLGSLVLLFASFVAVQLRYFFGGDTLVQGTEGLSYADYARRGFFELVTVAALVLPVLLAANSLLRREAARAERVYRVLATTLLVLLAVIMYSALARMRLYQSVYGMSTDRLYATVFMVWLAGVFAWFAATVLRGRGKRFVAGTFVSGLATLIGLNVIDPAGLVARSNIARAGTGKELDVRYVESLGADAAPALVAYLVKQPLTPPAGWTVPGAGSVERSGPKSVGPRDSFTARCDAARNLLQRWGPEASHDWRSWTIGRSRARMAVERHETNLRRLAGLGPSTGNVSECPAPNVVPGVR
jgi:hypothetical protein